MPPALQLLRMAMQALSAACGGFGMFFAWAAYQGVPTAMSAAMLLAMACASFGANLSPNSRFQSCQKSIEALGVHLRIARRVGDLATAEVRGEGAGIDPLVDRYSGQWQGRLLGGCRRWSARRARISGS